MKSTMNIKNRFVLGIVLLLSVIKVQAQVDPHFSQYYAYPLGLNPGLTGAMNGDYRVSAIYRNQWRGITNPFSTIGISADVATDKNISIGANLFHQSAGDGGYKYMNGYVSVAYTGVKLDAQKYKTLAFGIQGGFINRRFDPAKLQFGDQWFPGIGFNPSIPTGDGFNQLSASAFDLGVGVSYYDGNPEAKISPYFGVSANHLTQPEDPFLFGDKEKLPMKLGVHGGVWMNLSANFSLVPNVAYMRQGNAQEFMLGAYLQRYVNENTDFLMGANWRINDAVVPFAGIYYNGFTIGLSYDVTSSPLSKATNNTGSFELSLSYTGRKKSKMNTNYFKCPRL